MKNEAWFYKGVRYAKDGRYACYCDTPAKKRTVLLKNTVRTLSIERGDVGLPATITPFNPRCREFTVKYNAARATGTSEKRLIDCQAFTDSNYFIFHDMSTGQYWCYYIDYIEPIQQIGGEAGENVTLGELVSFSNNVTFRVGISVDWWQTFFFKMRTKAQNDGFGKPTYCAPHSTTSDSINEVVMPDFDFANISRTNMNNILAELGDPTNSTAFRPIQLTKAYTVKGEERVINLYLGGMTANVTPHYLTSSPYWVIMKFQLADGPSTTSLEFRGTLFGLYNLNASQSSAPSTIRPQDWGQVRRMLNDVLVSTGKIAGDFNFPSELFGEGMGSLSNNQQYSLEEAWAIPEGLAKEAFSNYVNSNNFFEIIPTNRGVTSRVVYALPSIAQNIDGMIWGSSEGKKKVSNNTRKIAYSASGLKELIQTYYPETLPSSVFNTLIPYITFGTRSKRIPISPSINGAANKSGRCAPICTLPTDTRLASYIWTELELTPYSFRIYISNGIERTDVTSDFTLPIRNVTDGEEISRQKQVSTLNQISQGIGLMGSVFGAAGSIATGNVLGAVMSTGQIAQQSIQLGNSIANAPNYDKYRKSELSNPEASSDASDNLGTWIGLFIPVNQTNANIGYADTYNEEFTEIGIEVGGALYRNFLLADNSAVQNTGFIEMGCVLLNIQQEAGEILEKRFREGVNFWYV